MRVCPRCGEDNAERARFCSNCGAGLEEPVAAGEERKVVSVLFVDLVGFTAGSDRADPEDVRATLRPYHARVKQEIERFGGTVEKFVGDAVMAVFGAPLAHEDDAERAVRAGLRITDAIDELNQEHGLGLSIRAAVNTGEAVVALGARPELGEGIVTGDVVNVASRLQGVAPVGGVVVGELTYRATSDPIEYEELEPVAVKGKDEPVPVWRAVQARSRFGVDIEPGTTTPLIGRDHELSLLEDLLRRAVREQSPQLVTLSGEPGVGKSRLTREFRTFIDDLPDLIYWRQGRCLPYGEGITFWALGEIVKSHAGIHDNDTVEEASVKLAQAVSYVVEDRGEQEWIRARLAPLVGVGEETATAEREESFAAWRSFLEAIAATDPFVLVFEDLHWADAPMLAFLEHLVDWATGVPMLVVCTARPELYERLPGWGGGKRNSTTIALSPLSEEETARLISFLLQQAVLPAETQRALLERAGGNPLFAEEFVRMLVDRGVLVRQGPVWDLSGVEEIAVPETVQALVAARLDTLTPERKALLQDAAVIGKVFWSGALAAMGKLDAREIREGLHELALKEMVRPVRRSSIQGEAEHAFWHLLIRDVAYGQIPRTIRMAKHRAAAEWIERTAGDRVGDVAELLVHHYEQALQLARATGDDGAAAGVAEPLARSLVMAAERARHLDATKAAAHYRRALQLLPARSLERARVLRQLAPLLFFGGGASLDEALRLFEEAVELFRDLGDNVGAGAALVEMVKVLWESGGTPRARAALDQAVALLEREAPGPELAEAYLRVAARCLIGEGDPTAALEWCDRALPIIEGIGRADLRARWLDLRGMARVDLGDVGGLDDLREGLRRYLELGLGHETAVAYDNLAGYVRVIEGPLEALELNRTSIDFQLRRGLVGSAGWTKADLTWTLFDLGAWDELLRVADEVLEKFSAEARQIRCVTTTKKAKVLAYRGRLAEAASLLGFLDEARAIRDPQVLGPALASAATIERMRGEFKATLRIMDELVDELGEFWGLPGLWGPARAEVVRALVAAGDPKRAAAMAEAIPTVFVRDRNARVSAQAIVREAKGSLGDGAELYGQAAVAWSEFGCPLERGFALLGAGRCRLGLSQPREAEASLREAREVFAGLGATPLLEETDALLEQAIARTS